MMLGRRELGLMDWEREEQRIRDLEAPEIISAIVNAPTEHLAAIVAAVESGGMCWFCHES
jgi:hypothetical protein